MENFLGYIEFHVVDRCNLNCNGCSHFSPMVKKDWDHLNSFKKDIFRLKELFESIETIRLLGGEPFLESRLDEFVQYTRQAYPDSKIEVATNGLLVPSQPERILRAISDNDVLVNITVYPPTEKMLRAIKSTLEKYKVKYSASGTVESFRKCFCPKGENDMNESFQKCSIGKRCTFLYDGKIYLCSAPVAAGFINEYYGTDIDCENCFVDIYDPLTNAQKIKKFLSRANGSCRYCGEVFEEPWSICKNLNNIDLEHWISNSAKRLG